MKKSAAIIIAALLAGCGSVPQHNSTPDVSLAHVNPIGLENVRTWGNMTHTDISVDHLGDFYSHYQSKLTAVDKPFNILALSGGGANGAFGAGILTAWSEKGTRPDFDIVTGVSTGAILSVFAYLGTEYDYEIIDFYTNYNDSDLYIKKGLFRGLLGTSLFNIKPFEEMVRDTITPEFLTKVAAIHYEGRRLYIGTAHLESQRLSVWNMGEIASHATPESEKLFEDIILASTAVPGAMPGVQIDVEYQGEQYHELHVDGGVARQVFLFPDTISAKSLNNSYVGRRPEVYVIRNGEFLPYWKSVAPSTKEISGRSLETIIKYQGRSDVLRIYQQSQEASMNFHFAHVDSDFNVSKTTAQHFDQQHMQTLFDYGYQKMMNKQIWQTKPPEFDQYSLEMVKAAQ